MDLELEGKIALVTAATEGLGLACATGLVKAGCVVAICGRGEQALAAARAKLSAETTRGVLATRVDITDRRSRRLKCFPERLRRRALSAMCRRAGLARPKNSPSSL